MPRPLPLLFLAALVAEIASIIWVGNRLGVIPTLLLMVLSGIIGVRMIKSAGMSVAAALRAPVQPGTALSGVGGRAAARAVSGLLFLLPGFFSDALGLALFLPQLRRWLATRFQVETFSQPPPAEDRRFGQVIDVEAVEITAEIEPPARGQG